MLTFLDIEKAKPRDKPYKITDGKGLSLLIQPNGSKLWRLRYRFAGKENMLTLGQFPEISLSAAREKRDDARRPSPKVRTRPRSAVTTRWRPSSPPRTRSVSSLANTSNV